MLAALVERVDPAAVLIATSADGKEIAGRLAVRTGSGWLNDVVALDAQGRTHSVFGGAWTAQAKANTAHPVITVRPGSVEPVAGGGRGRGGERRRPAVRAAARRSCRGSR